MSRDQSVNTEDLIYTDPKQLLSVLNINEVTLNASSMNKLTRVARDSYGDLLNTSSFNVIVPKVLYSNSK